MNGVGPETGQERRQTSPPLSSAGLLSRRENKHLNDNNLVQILKF